MLEGDGVPLDAVRVDFAAGAVEQMVMRFGKNYDILAHRRTRFATTPRFYGNIAFDTRFATNTNDTGTSCRTNSCDG
jgi:hypothetical protein